MNELVWLLPILNAFLWFAGGKWNKLFRRLGFPILVLWACLLVKLGLWMALGTTILAGVGPWLPFTLIGDGVRKHWLNWVWIVACPLFLLGPALIHFSFNRLLFVLWAWPIVASANVLSNLMFSKDSFKWKFVEGLTGFLALSPYLL
jgi:hypothetical protein